MIINSNGVNVTPIAADVKVSEDVKELLGADNVDDGLKNTVPKEKFNLLKIKKRDDDGSVALSPIETSPATGMVTSNDGEVTIFTASINVQSENLIFKSGPANNSGNCTFKIYVNDNLVHTEVLPKDTNYKVYVVYDSSSLIGTNITVKYTLVSTKYYVYYANNGIHEYLYYEV